MWIGVTILAMGNGAPEMQPSVAGILPVPPPARNPGRSAVNPVYPDPPIVYAARVIFGDAPCPIP
jgi:hypothetical protein